MGCTCTASWLTLRKQEICSWPMGLYDLQSSMSIWWWPPYICWDRCFWVGFFSHLSVLWEKLPLVFFLKAFGQVGKAQMYIMKCMIAAFHLTASVSQNWTATVMPFKDTLEKSQCWWHCFLFLLCVCVHTHAWEANISSCTDVSLQMHSLYQLHVQQEQYVREQQLSSTIRGRQSSTKGGTVATV